MNSFVCKIVILENKQQRILKPRKTEDNTLERLTKSSSIKKCLFGVASPIDTEEMLQEQYEIDRKRFNEKFGFDIKEVENLDNEENSENISGCSKSGKMCTSKRKILRGQRTVFKPHNGQAVITDFYQARKNAQSLEKFSKKTKEN